MKPQIRDLLIWCGAAALGATVGAYLGAPGWGAALGLAINAGLQWLQLDRLLTWSRHELAKPPVVGGTAGALAQRLWQQHRSARNRMHDIAASMRQLQNTADALPDAAVMVDASNEILWFNRAATKSLGIGRAHLGDPLNECIASPEIHSLLEAPDAREHLELASPLDERTQLDIRLVEYAEGRRILLARDMTEIALLRSMRQDFIANLSHELRTPLTVMIGYLEGLEGETDTDLIKATLGKLRRPGSRMRSLVEDLLLLSRLDSSAPSEDAMASFDPTPLIHRISTEAMQLSDGQHEFRLDLDSSVLVHGVDQELHSAFANLVFNAVRYSPDGGVIDVSWQEEMNAARFTVRDEGIGIAPEHLPRLTERFYRVDVGRSRDAGGTGLGLAIVKHVLRRHDCELEVHSQPGKGSTFSFRFPPDRVTRVRGGGEATSIVHGSLPG